MRLTTAHKITISASVAFGGLFTGWSVHRYVDQSETAHLLFACGSGAATVALFVYLLRFTRKLRGQASANDAATASDSTS
jgi:bacteriorhodopsin